MGQIGIVSRRMGREVNAGLPLLESPQAQSPPCPMRLAFFRVPSILLLLALTCASLHAAATYALDLNGKPVRDLAGPGVRVVVLIFAASDCPISNRYVPEIARLNQEFSGKGVRIWWVFPNPEDNGPLVAKHNHDFAIQEPTLIDTQQNLVRLAHATVTPEAAVFTAHNGVLREVYHGRIDDRYLSIGRERPKPSLHDLENAISASLAGEPIARAAVPPVGCSIVYLEK